ncbi:SGNH/GDSL hydrolase family protein [Streptomyces sp. NPDC021100]|uniref:SGNH/GDSL hydrolase family protein n=1 Tax=Streptomyces sp. NPDC021100 TaxID=3365114 RepID=UPI003794D7ED
MLAAVLLAGTGAVYATQGDPGDRDAHWKVPRLAVMPLGDSITHGNVGSSTDSGYRAELWDRLSGHAGTLHFVGSERSGRVPDPDHEGHPGWTTEGLLSHIGTWLPAAAPNVVLLHIGTNDLNENRQVDAAPRRLGALIDKITTAAPGMTVLVSSLVPAADPVVRRRVEAFNAAVPDVVAERRAKGFHVGYVDMGEVTTGDLANALHPKDSGYTKMSAAFYRAIARAAADGWIRERVDVTPPPARASRDDRRER